MMNFRSFAIVCFLSVFASPSVAQNIVEHGDWVVYNDKENDTLACVMSSVPQTSEGKYSSRGQIFAIVTHRPAEKRFNEFSFQAGYSFKDGAEVSLVIDKKASFSLFTSGGHAWAKDAQADKDLSAAMRAGHSMVINGISSRGTLTTDTFSLKGVSAALNAINKACKVQ
jgi:invasion protein IalB